MSKKVPAAPFPDTLDVDLFEDAYDRATNAAAILHELAEAKATGDTRGEENRLWWGVRDLTGRVLANLEQIKKYETGLSNYVLDLREGRQPAKGEIREKTGGAR